MIDFIPVGTKNEKGKSLERVFGSALTNLGYTDLRYNSQSVGEEIDIKGIHRVTLHPIKCQCKAHSDDIGAPPLRTFLGDVVNERDREPQTTGIFISSSGFKGSARDWYDRLSNEKKDFYKLVDDKDLYSILNDAKMVCSEDKLKLSVSMKTKIPFKDSSLILSERGIFWEVRLKDENSGEIYYMLLDGNGIQVNLADMEYLLSKPQLSGKNYVLLEIKESILLELLKVDKIDIDELISNINDPPVEIKATISNLLAEQIIENSSSEISLREEIDSLLGLTNYFKDSDNLIRFMTSNYFKSTIETIIIPFIQTKFRLTFTDTETKVVGRIISVSPKALIFSIFGDSTHYINNAEHLDKLSLEESKRREHEERTKSKFIEKLSTDLMIDCELSNNTELLSEYDIALWMTKNEIALAKNFETFLKVIGDKNFVTRLEVDGPIKAGQLVSVTGPGPLLKMGNAALAINEFDYARGEYDSVIENWSTHEDAVIAAIHNKGLSYLAQQEFEKAKNEFEKVRFVELARPQVLINLCKCYKALGMVKALENTLIVVSMKWPEENKVRKELNL